MAETANPATAKNRKPLLVGVLLAVVGAGAGFAATSGMMPKFGGGHAADPHAVVPGVSFLPLDPILVNLSNGDILRFSAQLEVEPTARAEIGLLQPRIIDVLNTYLRAVSAEELIDPVILPKLRSQMMRRIDLVVGDGKVRDLLVMEYVIN